MKVEVENDFHNSIETDGYEIEVVGLYPSSDQQNNMTYAQIDKSTRFKITDEKAQELFELLKERLYPFDD